MKIFCITAFFLVSLLVSAQAQSDDNGLTSLEKQDFDEKVLSKTEDLGNYIKIIGNKKTDSRKAKGAIDLAIGLFMSADNKVHTSSKDSKTVDATKIKEYFNNLRLLQYDQVEITWAEIGYVSDLRKHPDGNYYGTVTIKQKFVGKVDGKIIYEDTTIKHLEVMLKQLEIDSNTKEKVWDVRLGDISVVETY